MQVPKGYIMSAITRLFTAIVSDENYRLRTALADIAHHIGGSPGLPETIVEAAESARVALNRYQGHPDIPRDADGHPVAFSLVGR
jgi:hypothetical protein